MPNFTLVLKPEVAERVRFLIETFGGSVGGFGAGLVSDVSHLTPDQIKTVREQIRVLGDANKADAEATRTRELAQLQRMRKTG